MVNLIRKFWIKLLAKKHKGIQLFINEILLIFTSICEYPECKLLVFGLGNDTPLWLKLNKKR